MPICSSYAQTIGQDRLPGWGQSSEHITSVQVAKFSKPLHYQGSLKDSVRYTSAGMMKMLNTNMTGLNVNYALQLIGNEKLNGAATNVTVGLRNL
ncbi:MAG: hypothetical protein RSB25_00910 [Acinetobacter sp.]